MRCGWLGSIVAALATGLLPGCLPAFNLRGTSPGAEESRKQQPPTTLLQQPKPIPDSLPPQPIDVEPPVGTPYVPATSVIQPNPPSPPPMATTPLPKTTQALPTVNKVEAPPPPDPEVVAALRRLLDRRTSEAMEILGRYGKPSQETLWRVLEIAGRLHEKGLDGLAPEELCDIQDSLKKLGLVFQSRAPLHVAKMYFFESGRGPGEYQLLKQGHIFRAGRRDRPGELVQVHVEFQNLASEEKRDHTYQTELLCSAEISDPNDKVGRPIWKKDLDYGKKILIHPVPRSEFAMDYAFYMPDLPAGNLVLTLTVQDLTRPDHPRQARRSLEFYVNNQSERPTQTP
jgi:hypothetical protein